MEKDRGGSNASASDAPAAKRARLEALMGGPSSTIGFGAAKPSAPAAITAPVWNHPAQEVVHFRLVESADRSALEKEVASGGIEFEGEFFHQHFGEDEEIKGYLDLQVNLWLSAQTYHAWLDIKYSKKKLSADKIEKVFREAFPGGFVKTKAEFIDSIVGAKADLGDLLQIGEHVADVPLPTKASVPASSGLEGISAPQNAAIMKFPLGPKAHPTVRALHERMEPLLLFFIDGASLIDNDDDKWELLLAVLPKQGMPGGAANLVVGMTTCYNFWSYPASTRVRLSQIMVLPPYQSLGLGKTMIRVVYDLARQRQCADLTIEDPTPNLQRVREKLEVEMMRGLPWLVEQAQKCAAAAAAGETVWPAAAAAGAGNEENVPPPAGQQQAAAQRQQQQQQQQQLKQEQQPKQEQAGGKAAGADASGSSKAGGSSSSTNPCVPPASFLARITSELKIYRAEARCAWEALLYLQPGLTDTAKGRASLERLVRARLETAHFAHNAPDAERKVVVGLGGRNKKGSDREDFIMMRAKGATDAAAAGAAAPAPAGGEGAGGAVAASGRLSVVLVSAEEKATKLGELLEERMDQLATMKRLMRVGARARTPVAAA